MSGRIFQLLYDDKSLEADELQSLSDRLKDIFQDDIVLIMPDTMHMRESNLNSLIEMRDALSKVIFDITAKRDDRK
jgi:hypothetical protein